MNLIEARAEFRVDGDRPQFKECWYKGPEVGIDMELLQEIDGPARVSVSMDMSDKDFGAGFTARVSISLGARQEEGTLRAAHGLAEELCSDLVSQTFDAAKRVFKSKMRSGGGG